MGSIGGRGLVLWALLLNRRQRRLFTMVLLGTTWLMLGRTFGPRGAGVGAMVAILLLGWLRAVFDLLIREGGHMLGLVVFRGVGRVGWAIGHHFGKIGVVNGASGEKI